MPRDLLKVRCSNCRMPGTVTRALWARTAGQLACGGCRKTSTWKAA